jgi:hypothetical protein
MTFGEGQQVLYERSHSDSSIAFDQFQRWLQSSRGQWLFRAAQFTFQQPPVVTPQGARLSFRCRQTIGERVFIGGFQVQRQFLDDFDLAFGRQAQHGEMFAHDVVPIRHSSVVA